MISTISKRLPVVPPSLASMSMASSASVTHSRRSSTHTNVCCRSVAVAFRKNSNNSVVSTPQRRMIQLYKQPLFTSSHRCGVIRRNGTTAAISSNSGSKNKENIDQSSKNTIVQQSKAAQNVRSTTERDHDRLIVVGSGVAGSATALIAAECYGIPVTVLFAGQVPTDCNSYWAQGGIIYRNYDPNSGDSAESLSADIHRAGAGLCVDDAVWKVATEGPERVRQLLLSSASQMIDQDTAGSSTSTTAFANVPFDLDPVTQKLALCLEASHAAPRILHKADHTGAVITQHITAAAAAHPLITFQSNTIVTDLITRNDTCVGVETMDRLSGASQLKMYASRGVVLATGGLGGIYEHSTNPAGFNALGSSVALATRIGAVTRDLEYVQFHPTALCIENEPRFLLTEALRGEGAILRDASGRRFCQDYHEAGELAPRDIVARAVYAESQKTSVVSSGGGLSKTNHNVFLDITHRDADWLHKRFPTIQSYLKQRNMDLAHDQLPITPAAHYTCGGIETDLNGRTSVRGLYAAGEAARTGLHGGNRLASTSLLEGLVFGASVADFIGNTDEGQTIASESAQLLCDTNKYIWYHNKRNGNTSNNRTTMYEPYQLDNASYRAMHLLTLLRKVMWDNVGVIRTPGGLDAAIDILYEIHNNTEHLHYQCPTIETAAVRDAATAGLAVARAARANPLSVGAHCIVPDHDVMEVNSPSNDDDSDDYDELHACAHMR